MHIPGDSLGRSESEAAGEADVAVSCDFDEPCGAAVFGAAGAVAASFGAISASFRLHLNLYKG